MRNAIDWMRSLLFLPLFYGGTLACVILAAVGSLVSNRMMRAGVNGWGLLHRTLCRVVLNQRVLVVGDLPQGTMLYVFKHESMFETIDLLCLFDNPIVIAKQELLDIPGWGGVAQRYGVIGLRRDQGATALRHLKREVAKGMSSGRSICLFPEGTRVPHGQSPPMKSGFAALYQLIGLPVVPIAVDSGRLSPRNSLLKRPGTVTYKVGEIIPPGLPRAEAEARVHAAINALNEAP